MPTWWSNKSRPKSKANHGALVPFDLDEAQGQQRGNRSVDPIAFARGRNTSASESILNEDMPFMSRSLPREHQRFFEVPVYSVREDHLHRDQPSTSETSCSRGRTLFGDISVPRTRSLSPGPKGNVCALNNGNSREIGFSPRSPVRKMDGLRSPPHPLPLPPAPRTCLPLPPAPNACSPLPSSPSSCLPLPSSPTTCSESQSQWKNGKLLGSGTSGEVYLGFYNENGQFCAIKEVQVIMDDPHSKERLKQLNQVIRPRPDTAEFRREALQAQLEEERRLREEMSRKMEEDRQRMEVKRQKMEHMFHWMQSLSEKMGQPMPKMLFPTPPPPTSTLKSIGGME